MTYEQAVIGKPHAYKVIEVLEGLNWQCSKCKGNGQLWLGDGKGNAQCDKCNGAGEIEYSWTPQVGEFCVSKANQIVFLIAGERRDTFFVYPQNNSELDAGWISKGKMPQRFIPILEWETIQQILLKSNLYLSIEAYGNQAICRITRYEVDKRWDADKEQGGGGEFLIAIRKGENCQEAVGKAIDTLGKQLEKEKEKL